MSLFGLHASFASLIWTLGQALGILWSNEFINFRRSPCIKAFREFLSLHKVWP